MAYGRTRKPRAQKKGRRRLDDNPRSKTKRRKKRGY